MGVINSLDAARYQRLMAKQKQFNQLLRGNFQGQFVEDPLNDLQLSFQEQMAAYSGNPKVMEMVRVENSVREMESLLLGHAQQVSQAQRTLTNLQESLPIKKNSLDKALADSGELRAVFGNGKDFEPVLELGGKVYTGKKDAQAALDAWASDAIERFYEHLETQQIKDSAETKAAQAFRLNGEPVEASLYAPRGTIGNVTRQLEGIIIYWQFASRNNAKGNMTTGVGFFNRSLPTVLERVHLQVPQELQDSIAIDERSLRELVLFVQQPFDRAQELRQAQQRLDGLREELRAEGVQTSQTPEGEPVEIDFPVSLETLEGLPTEEIAKRDAQIAGLRRSIEAAEQAGDVQRVKALRERIAEIEAQGPVAAMEVEAESAIRDDEADK